MKATEIIELVDFLEVKIIELTSKKEFKLVKPSIKKKAFGITNIGIELKYYVLFDANPDEKKIEDAIDLMNQYYCAIYDSKDRIKKTIFLKPKPEL